MSLSINLLIKNISNWDTNVEWRKHKKVIWELWSDLILWIKLDWKTWQYENRYDSRDNQITFDGDYGSDVDGYNSDGFYQWIHLLESA